MGEMIGKMLGKSMRNLGNHHQRLKNMHLRMSWTMSFLLYELKESRFHILILITYSLPVFTNIQKSMKKIKKHPILIELLLNGNSKEVLMNTKTSFILVQYFPVLKLKSQIRKLSTFTQC